MASKEHGTMANIQSIEALGAGFNLVHNSEKHCRIHQNLENQCMLEPAKLTKL
jgi:hypothetical protein